jgi:hypothetical protein
MWWPLWNVRVCSVHFALWHGSYIVVTCLVLCNATSWMQIGTNTTPRTLITSGTFVFFMLPVCQHGVSAIG